VVQELVMERFRVLERIGSGGMGTVYRAYDERLEREVALKQLDSGDADRVLREAQAAARLNHPSIVTLYELGEHAGRAVLVSELVPGETLDELRWAGELYDRDVAEVVSELCEALAHAHARGVVHRDIKPQNVIVCDDPRTGRAKLMDFGIARLAGAPTLTAAGEVVGTLAYMSPEQAEGELAGPPTDVYSLALTAYECWAGENPVAGSSPAQTARRIGSGIEPLRDVRPDLPEGLADTIDACLDPDPDLRPTPAELRECLEAELPGLDSTYPLEPAGDAEENAERERFALRSIGAAILCAAAAPALATVGLGNAATALGSIGRGVLGRAFLGALAWIAMVAAGTTNVDQLASVDCLLGVAVFAPSAVLLGWVLRARHLAIALLGAMLWAAAVDGALAVVGDGTLGQSPSGLVIAALTAVALEFGLVRGVVERRPVATARARALSGRLA
jgi:serine/threonine-protein kinase